MTNPMPIFRYRAIGRLVTLALTSYGKSLLAVVPDAHTLGKNILCQRYAAMLSRLGGDKAIYDFLEKHHVAS